MRFMRWALVGVIAVLVSCGSESSPSTSDSSLASTVTETKDEYNVGDIGPGGGIIFYVDEAGFSNSDSEETGIGSICLVEKCNYLEMAPTDLQGQYPWDDAMVAAGEFATQSADDWVLPPRDALNVMCKFAFGDTVNDICNNNGAGSLALGDGGFSPSNYWSSSPMVDDIAWTQDFLDGVQDGSRKVPEEAYFVRPVRAF